MSLIIQLNVLSVWDRKNANFTYGLSDSRSWSVRESDDHFREEDVQFAKQLSSRMGQNKSLDRLLLSWPVQEGQRSPLPSRACLSSHQLSLTTIMVQQETANCEGNGLTSRLRKGFISLRVFLLYIYLLRRSAWATRASA